LFILSGSKESIEEWAGKHRVKDVPEKLLYTSFSISSKSTKLDEEYKRDRDKKKVSTTIYCCCWRRWVKQEYLYMHISEFLVNPYHYTVQALVFCQSNFVLNVHIISCLLHLLPNEVD